MSKYICVYLCPSVVSTLSMSSAVPAIVSGVALAKTEAFGDGWLFSVVKNEGRY